MQTISAGIKEGNIFTRNPLDRDINTCINVENVVRTSHYIEHDRKKRLPNLEKASENQKCDSKNEPVAGAPVLK